MQNRSLLRANYHTHTVRCKHAVGSEREYIEAAIKAGYEVLGFADHGPYIFEGDYYSSFRMRPEELSEYVATLQALKKEYEKDIKIYIGLESEYYPTLFPKLRELLRNSGVEYLIMGQHYAKIEPAVGYSGRPGDDRNRLTDYVNSVIEGAQSGLFSYIAHPDIINFTGDRDFYLAEMERLVIGVVGAGVPLEMNILGLREGRIYPREDFWELVAKHGGTAILGMDAHCPEHICDEKTVERAVALLKKLGIVRTEAPDLTRLERLL